MQVVLTRARADAEVSAARLESRGFEPILLPVTQIVATSWEAPAEIDFVVATSRHAFAGFLDRAERERAALLSRPLYAVGPATAAAARAAGFRDLRIAGGDAKSLTDLLLLTQARGRALYLAGADRKPTVEAALARLAVETRLALAYEARALDWDAAARSAAATAARAGAATLHYSRRGAGLFLTQIAAADLDESLHSFRHFALSEDAAAPIRERGARVEVPNHPGEDDLFALLAP